MARYNESIAECEGEAQDTSIIMIDNRDDRMVSPFQAWLVSEIMANAASSINVLTERDQVMPLDFTSACSATTPWMGSRQW